VQQRFCASTRSAAFYANQMLDHLNPLMQQFIARQSQYSRLTQNP
jgi:hypothetical protein